jgi:ribosomal protein S6E (S10)
MSFVATGVRTHAGRWMAQLLKLAPAALLLSGLFTVWAGPLAPQVAASSSSGTIYGWGNSPYGQMTADLSGIAAIAAGGNFSLALKTDGTVFAWGSGSQGQTAVPAGLSGVTAISAGYLHGLALKADGTVVGWGDNSYGGQATVPAGLSGVVAIAAGGNHSLALKSDGTVVGWGDNMYGESTIPAGLSGVTAIAAGGDFSVALKSDGTLVAWGSNSWGQLNVPAGLSGVTAISACSAHGLAIKADGTVVGWGDNYYGESTIPAGLSGVTAVAAGWYHSLALKSDGTVVAWGLNLWGETYVPSGLSGATAIAAGMSYSLAVAPAGPATTIGITALSWQLTAGDPVSVVVTPRDQFGHVAAAYRGTIHFTSSDSQASLPADYTFTEADAGVHSFSVTLGTVGSQSVGATDTAASSITGVLPGFTVSPGALDHLVLSPADATIVAGSGQSYSAQGLDAYGNSLGDLAASTTFSITGSGTCEGAFCRATVAGDYTITATDGSAAGTTTLHVIGGWISRLDVSGLISPTKTGVVGTMKVVAQDPYGNPSTWYRGTVHFASTDPRAVLPADYSFTVGDAGTHTFTATLNTAGTWSVTATDNAGYSGVQSGIVVVPNTVDQLVLLPSNVTVTAGQSWTYQAIGYDALGNSLGDVTATTTFSISGGGICSGATCWSVGAGDYTLTATKDGATATGILHISPGVPAQLVLSPLNATIAAGTSQTYAASAVDAYGNSVGDVTAASTFTIEGGGTCGGSTCTPETLAGIRHVTATYGGITATVPLTTIAGPVDHLIIGSSIGSAMTAGEYQVFQAIGADVYGNWSGDVTPATTFTIDGGGSCNGPSCGSTVPGSHTVTATYGTSTGSMPVYITAGPAAYFRLSGLPSPYAAGSARSVTVTAYDPYGNVATGYTGTVHFTSTDTKAVLPGDHTFTSANAGTHTFVVTLKTAGTRVVTATDKVSSSIKGAQTVTVATPGVATSLKVSGLPSPYGAGSVRTLTVTALDAFGYTATGYRGTAHFTSTDGKAVLPGDYTFTSANAGTHNFSVTLKTAGTRAVTVTDKATSSISGVQVGINVTPGSAKTLAVSGLPSPYGVGSTHAVTVTALDAYGNVATGYRGLVHFTSTDTKAALPADYTFTSANAGTHSFNVILKTAGTRSGGGQRAVAMQRDGRDA